MTLDKNIEIDGANSGTSGTGVRGAESIIRGQMTVTAAHSQRAHVTINGVEIYNTSDNSHPFIGINVTSGADVTVTNSVFFSPVPNGNVNGTGDMAILLPTAAHRHDRHHQQLDYRRLHGQFRHCLLDQWRLVGRRAASELNIDNNTFKYVRSGINLDGYDDNKVDVSHNIFQYSGTGMSVGAPTGGELHRHPAQRLPVGRYDFNLKNVTTPVGFDLTATANTYSGGVPLAGGGVIQILGGTAGDHIKGSAGADSIIANGGDDTIYRDAGNELDRRWLGGGYLHAPRRVERLFHLPVRRDLHHHQGRRDRYGHQR